MFSHALAAQFLKQNHVFFEAYMQRREFLKTSALAGSAYFFFSKQALATTADAHIEVLVNEPIATIQPEIYGHFTEHLGGVIYDGVWVGVKSSIANVHGIRKELVDKLKAIKAPVIRWPGGCFADSYDWRDGIGPRDKRPRRTNFWAGAAEWPKSARRNGPQSYDPNQFGTIEFTRFCKATGAQPYFAANLRGSTAQDFDRWVEYCNSPAGTTTLADRRAADGERDALNVRYWGVGNEAWGCGGSFTPDDYATEFRRYSAWTPDYSRSGGAKLALVASGPNGDDIDWTRRFFARVNEHGGLGRVWGFALHHY